MSMWDDEAGYDRTDPKHPSWRDGMATAADMRRKAARDNPSTGRGTETRVISSGKARHADPVREGTDRITEATNAAIKAVADARAAVDELERALKDGWPW